MTDMPEHDEDQMMWHRAEQITRREELNESFENILCEEQGRHGLLEVYEDNGMTITEDDIVSCLYPTMVHSCEILGLIPKHNLGIKSKCGDETIDVTLAAVFGASMSCSRMF